MARISDITLPGGTKYDIGQSTGAEYIRGTWTAATNAWTGVTTDSELYDNKEIVLYLPFAGTSTATTLNLTLSGGGTTGAKAVYFNSTTRHTTHYGQYQMVRMVYHKSHDIAGTNYEGWWMDYARDTTINYQVRQANSIKAAEAVTAGRIIVGTAAGYKNVASGVTFDIDYPILYAGSNIGSGSTGSNNFLFINNINYANNKSGYTGTTYSTIYLVCSAYVGKTLTIDSTIFTTSIPTSADGKYYIPIGLQNVSTTNGDFNSLEPKVFAYINSKFTEVSGASVKTITRSGTTFTVTRVDGETFTFTQQDNNTTYTAATAAPGNIATTGAVGTSTNYARQDHTHGISLATGDSNGQVKIAGTNVSVKGLGTAAYTASTSYLAASLKGAKSGVAELDANGMVPSSQLPSYVDDVLEYDKKASFPATGETGKIYVDKATNLTYRWSGSAYVEISPSLALGTTSSTAFRGDYGNSAYAHAVTNKGSAFASGLYKITTNAEGHVTAATAVTKADITGLGIPGSDTHYTTHLIAGASASATANAAATNGNVYLNVLDNSTVRDSHNIVGSGSVTVTSDANGKITINGTDNNTDTKVTNTLATTTKSYVTGTATATTNTGTQNFDTGVYLTTTAGELNATQYKINEKARMQYNTTTNAIDFVFV